MDILIIFFAIQVFLFACKKGDDSLKLMKLLNNNAAIVVDEHQNEFVVIGSGIAFDVKKGENIHEEKIDRIFSSKNQQGNKLIQLINEIPEFYLELTEEIVEYAQSILEKQLNDSIYLTLTDHIYYLKERYLQGISLTNPLKWEIQRYYVKEYQIGKKAKELLENELEIELSDDEIATLALHIVNSEVNANVHDSMEMVQIMNKIMQIIQYATKIPIDENDLNYQRLITHMRFFVQRVFSKKQTNDDNSLLKIVKENYKEAYAIAMKVAHFVESQTLYTVSEDEITYLTIHIQRVLKRKK